MITGAYYASMTFAGFLPAPNQVLQNLSLSSFTHDPTLAISEQSHFIGLDVMLQPNVVSGGAASKICKCTKAKKPVLASRVALQSLACYTASFDQLL